MPKAKTPEENEAHKLLGAFFAKARARAGFSQEQVAVALGLRMMTIIRWERGTSGISALDSQKLSKLYGITSMPQSIKSDTVYDVQDTALVAPFYFFVNTATGLQLDRTTMEEVRGFIEGVNNRVMGTKRRRKRPTSPPTSTG